MERDGTEWDRYFIPLFGYFTIEWNKLSILLFGKWMEWKAL